jgi:uncharacterized protein (DUF433 family)/DNA-binding transcriptional MerR regulator
MSDPGNVISAFSEEDVARLTGVSIRQLRYWDTKGFFKPSLADENRRLAHSRVYTFRDVVCLKVLNEIRNHHEVPLPRLQEAKVKLAHLGEDMWAKVTFYILKRSVVVVNPETERKEDVITGQVVLEIPLPVVGGDMEKAVRALRTSRDANTIGKIHRRRGTAASKPVIAGTRIPVKSIKAFAKAGYSIDQIREQYPILTVADIEAALDYSAAA